MSLNRTMPAEVHRTGRRTVLRRLAGAMLPELNGASWRAATASSPLTRAVLMTLLILSAGVASSAFAQTSDEPFPTPIASGDDAILVDFVEFTSVPNVDGDPARMMLLVDEPSTSRMFVNDMRGPLYSISHDGQTVTEYVDINDATWGISVESSGSERGFQSFAFHPQFGEPGAPGYGKFYTWTDTDNTEPTPDFVAGGDEVSHHTVLHEWTARTPDAATYDGDAPRELARFEQPFGNHNAGHLAFNPLASPGDPDFGLLYVGVADGGSGGDPLEVAQNLGSAFGKILRLDPLGSNSANGQYGIPADNPFVNNADALGEIYAYGVRNPQRFAWDPLNGSLFLADIGQSTVEELSIVTAGANLGWNDWEGSFQYIGRSGVNLAEPRSDPAVTYPVVEYGQLDPLLQRQSAITGVHVYRGNAIPQLENLVLFGDNPSGEIFHFSADELPDGGQDAIGRILLNDSGQSKTLLQLIQEENAEQGTSPATRADLRFGSGPDGQVLLLNKGDGVIRLLVPDGSGSS